MTGPASRRYKEIVAGITQAVEDLGEQDRARAAELSRRLVELDARMLATGEGAALTRLGVELQWEAALEVLWVESWMKLRPRPGPDPRADPADLAALVADVEDAGEALQEAVRRRRFGLPGR
ncbi:hypothetical protein [Pseudonocardia sp. GCM10023141]|uniref:hypothetical protein n=1 Tax=Pseudonocardia sp. GCM10023141 TaxID=3252653 RepID=UPI003616F1D1